MTPHVFQIDPLCDNHVHTSLCHHATGAMEEYVVSALDRGLRRIVFLEHMESGIEYFDTTWLSEDDFDRYFEEGARLKRKYLDRIEIGLGVEVGYNPQRKEDLQERLSKRDWDHIGVSYHYHREPGIPYHLNLVSRKQWNIDTIGKVGPDRLLHRYLDTLTEAVRFLPGTLLCHLDAGLRHIPHLRFSESHMDKVAVLLDVAKAKSMHLEVNTSGFVLRGEPFPSSLILSMAKERGIPLAASSDAHKPEDVGRHFRQLPDFINAGTRP